MRRRTWQRQPPTSPPDSSQETRSISTVKLKIGASAGGFSGPAFSGPAAAAAAALQDFLCVHQSFF